MTLRSRIREWWRGARVDLWYHPTYRLPFAAAVGAPADPRRADDALAWVASQRVVPKARVHSPAELSWADASLVHGDGWLQDLDRAEVVAHVLGAEPERISVREIVETWRRASGGTVEAARHVARAGGRAVNLLGGFHHAEPDRGGGFCAINDVSVAIARLRADGFGGRVAVVDLDAHPPDGIVACSGGDERLEVLSLSTASHWSLPPAPAARVVDERVPAGAGDEVYLEALRGLLRRLERVDLAFYLAGGDPLEGDRLGGLAVTAEGLRRRDREVLAALGATPTVVLPAGGYSRDSWRVLAATIAESARSRAPVAATFDPLRWRMSRVARRLMPVNLGGPPEDELMTEAELLGALGVPGRTEPRFLGYYTRHGLEHALHAYGYLPTLARLGFRDLRLDIVTGRGPDRMVITADVNGEPQLVVDLAVSIRALDRWRVLFVEWLELRDPRVPFSAARPRLPGQQLPGLGMAEETMQLLVRAAERLGLDGVSFVPAHYHVAWMARGPMVVVDPEARGRFEALSEHLSPLPLLEASRLLGGRGVDVEHGDPVRWEPTEMVIPLEDGLRRWVADGDGRAAQARAALLDRLLPLPPRTLPQASVSGR